MATGQLIEMKGEGREPFAGVLRFYELAKRQEWQVRDLPWGDLPPIPEGKGTPERRARRNDMWRSARQDAWKPYVSGRIEVHAVDSGHFDMLDPEPLSTIATLLAERCAK